MKFWWTTIKEQRKEIERLESQLCIANSWRNNFFEIRNELNEINRKMNPRPSTKTNYTFDAIAFAKSLQSNRKRKICGGGSCAMKYEIPCEVIDKVANSANVKQNA